MWTCPKCAEQNEDNFQICWKCASDLGDTQFTAGEPPIVLAPRREPQLRSNGSIILRVVIAFVVGSILGGAAFQVAGRTTDPLTNGIWALVSGLALAIVIGICFWVIFPYVPGTEPEPEPSEKPDG
jgi:hypothetical protein